MIDTLILKILDAAPLPLLVGVTAILVLGWIITQLRSLPNPTFVLKERLFWYAAAAVVVLEAAWFSVQVIHDRSAGIRFSNKDLGIYIIRFDNDREGASTKIFAAVLESQLKTDVQTDYRILVKSSSDPSPENREPSEIFDATKAAIIIQGVLDKSDQLFVKFIKQGENDWRTIRNSVDLRQPAEFVDLIKANIKALDYSTRSGQEFAVENDLSNLKKQVEAQKLAIVELRKELASLGEKVGSANKLNGAVAQTKMKGQALVVGINQYRDKNLTLRFAKNDAEDMSSLFDASGLRTTKLFDEAATKSKISESFAEDLRKELEVDDVFFFYFAGHAVSIDGPSGEKAGYLCPADAIPAKIVTTCISMSEIGEWLTLLKAKTIVLILDSCVSGLIAQKLDTRSFTPIDESLKSAPPPTVFPAVRGKTIVVFTAGKPDQLSAELSTLQHGVFTFYLLQGLRGGAVFTSDGQVSLANLYQYTWARVEKETLGQQTPTLNVWGSEDVFLVGQRLQAGMPLRAR
jgi:hypothetical protein